MSTNNHTPIATYAALDASVANSPLAQLDAAIGDLTTLNTTPKSSLVAAIGTAEPTTTAKTLVGAINELDGEIGDLTTLGTTPKSSLVAAIGTAEPTTTAKTLAGAINELDSELGDLATLTTTAKSSLVDAVNELDGEIGDLASLTTAAKSSVVAAINAVNEFFVSGGSIPGDVAVTGTVTATAFVGDGAALTGIGSGTGGVINTGSTTVGADSGDSGIGVIALQTRGVTRVTIENNGNVTVANAANVGTTRTARNLDVTGNARISADVAPSSGAGAAMLVDGYAYDGAGAQWTALFTRTYSVAGQSSVAQLNGLLTALYHSAGFTVSEWQGVETGGCFVSGAGSVVTDSWGLAAALPTVSGGGAVTRAGAIHIKAMATTGITTAYAIFSELTSTSYFSGKLEVVNVSVALDLHRSGGGVTAQNTTYFDSASTGTNFTGRFARGTDAAPVQVNTSDLISQFSAQAYINGSFRTIGSLQFYAAATTGVGSYPGKLYVRLVSDGATSVSTKAIFDADGSLTLGSSVKSGSGVFYGGRVALGKNSAGAMLDVYADAADCVGLIINSRASPSQPLAQFKQDTTLKLVIGIEGILEYKGTMGNSALDPATDAPADWVQVVIGSTTYYLPAYAAS